MQSVATSLATLAFLGVVLLLFANSALLKMVRDLQEGLADVRDAVGRGAERQSVPAFASADGRSTFALLVDARCPACAERAERLVALAALNPSARLVAVSADAGCAAWFGDSGVTVHIDPVLFGHIGVNLTPTLLKYRPDGEEEWRRVVGSDADLDRLLGLTDSSPADPSSTHLPATAGADAKGGTT